MNERIDDDRPAAAQSETAAAQESEAEMKTYRLRLVRFDRPETKMVTVSCESEYAARCRVAARFGREWRVVSTQLAHFV